MFICVAARIMMFRDSPRVMMIRKRPFEIHVPEESLKIAVIYTKQTKQFQQQSNKL